MMEGKLLSSRRERVGSRDIDERECVCSSDFGIVCVVE